MAEFVNPTPPPSPVAGDKWFDSSTGRHFIWTVGSTGAGVWVQVPPAGMRSSPPPVSVAVPFMPATVTGKIPYLTAASFPPGDALPNDLWFDSSSGFFFMYYFDGNTTQWVVTNPGRGGSQGPPGPPGISWQGEWDPTVQYLTTNGVGYQGSSYLATGNSLNVVPGTDPTMWALIAEKGDTGAPGAPAPVWSTTTTSGWVQRPVGGNIGVSVTTPVPNAFVGMLLWLSIAGYQQIVAMNSPDNGIYSLLNTGDPSNAAPGTVMPAGQTVYDLAQPGQQGTPGAPGAPSTVPGPPGQGVPAGGTTGQYLVKSSNVDFATTWQALPALNYLPLGGGQLTATAVVGWTGHAQLSSPADGDFLMTNAAGTGFTMLQFGGTTNAFPALFRSGNAISVLTADGSAYATLNANNFNVQNGLFYGTFGSISSPGVDGQFEFFNNAGTAATRLDIATDGTIKFLNRAGTGDAITTFATRPTAQNDNSGATTAFVRAAIAAYAGGGSASISISDTPPVSPAAGALWWNSVLGALFLYYNDGNSTQWVPAAPSPSSAPTITRNAVAGFIHSHPGGTQSLAIGAGQCSDSTNVVAISGGAFTKTLAAFAAGSGNGGMGTGLTVAATTWYFPFAAIINGVFDIFFDTTPVPTHIPTGTTAYRRLRPIKTDGSSNIIAHTAKGDLVQWVTTINEPAQVSNFYTLGGVPPGIQTMWQGRGAFLAGAGGTASQLFTPGQTISGGSYIMSAQGPSGAQAGVFASILTDIQQRLGVSWAGSPTSLTIETYGFIDDCGRYD